MFDGAWDVWEKVGKREATDQEGLERREERSEASEGVWDGGICLERR